jgi:hypothetical protein
MMPEVAGVAQAVSGGGGFIRRIMIDAGAGAAVSGPILVVNAVTDSPVLIQDSMVIKGTRRPGRPALLGQRQQQPGCFAERGGRKLFKAVISLATEDQGYPLFLKKKG